MFDSCGTSLFPEALKAIDPRRRENPLSIQSGRFGYMEVVSCAFDDQDATMTLPEKILYHQIHPAKLGTDILAGIVSLFFLWQHQLALGLTIHFVPPIMASALLVSIGDFEAQKKSSLGRYVAAHMTRAVEAIRFTGDIAMALGAWIRSPALIAAGLLIVVMAWCSGPLRRH